MKNIVVDFESYYDKDLSVTTMGLPNYVAETEAYLVSMVTDEEEFCGSPYELRCASQLNEDPDVQFWAANSNFDSALWDKYYGATLRPWKCILDLAAYSQYPRDLAGVAKALLKIKLDKSTRDEMKGVRYEALPEDEQQKVLEYCLTDSVVEKQILDKLPPMSDVEDRIAEHTRMINRRGVHIDEDRVAKDKTSLERIRFETFSKIPWTKNEEPPLSYPSLARWCAGQGVIPPKSLDKRDLDCEVWLKANPVEAVPVLSMRTYRGANAKLKKLMTLQRNVTREGIMPLELIYCGARHTRRWSSKGFNVQNLDKEPVFAKEMGEWEGSEDDDNPGIFMREYLIPPPGCTFGIIDLAQIEPRCLNWLIRNETLLAAIRSGFSYYEGYAAAAKGWRGEPGTIKKELGGERYTKLKNEALGCGYGMGAAKYTSYAKVTEEEAEVVIKAFRRDNPKITSLWRMFDRQIAQATMTLDRHLEIEMPNGEKLHNFGCRAKAKGGFQSFTVRGDFSQQSLQPRLWGGTLTENVCQRFARDILAEGILRLEAAGFPVIFHAHDEVIISLPVAGAADALKQAEQLMTISPAWAPDLPLGVDSDLSPCYTKR